MRLWHVDLIHVLPYHQLLGQWRECCLIAKEWAEYGKPNHVLVNNVIKYPLVHYIWYCHVVIEEMENREYAISDLAKERLVKNLERIKESLQLFTLWTEVDFPIPEGVSIYPNWMNERYLIQCYFNLEEKYDRGAISPVEWDIIDDYVSSRVEHLL